MGSLRCIQVIAGVLGRAGEAGQRLRLAAAARGEITYEPASGLVVPGTEDEGDEATNVSRMGANGREDTRPQGAQSVEQEPRDPTTGESLGNVEDMEKQLDDVENHESHRTKDGRAIKISS